MRSDVEQAVRRQVPNAAGAARPVIGKLAGAVQSELASFQGHGAFAQDGVDPGAKSSQGFPCPGSHIARDCPGRELGLAIRRCLGRLISPRRKAVTLYLLGYSVPESARMLEWSAKRTENLTYRGLSSLRGCLREKGEEA